MNLELLKAYAFALVGCAYEYGGDDPMGGFDCSGLVCELMRASGVVSYAYRNNAQALFNMMKSMGEPTLPKLGALSFYGKSPDEVSHIGFCIDGETMIEAGGGDATTVNETVATRQNAFVRMRPIKYRRDFLLTVMPKYISSALEKTP